jgi:hypothetical protein
MWSQSLSGIVTANKTLVTSELNKPESHNQPRMTNRYNDDKPRLSRHNEVNKNFKQPEI